MGHIDVLTVCADAGDQELLHPVGSSELNKSRLNMDLMQPRCFVRRYPTQDEHAQQTQDTQRRGEVMKK